MFFFFQSSTAIFAIVGLEIVSVTMAARAFALFTLFVLAYHRCGDNACRYGYDGVTDKHDDSRDETPDRGDRGDVAISDSGHCDDGPVYAIGNVVETRSWMVAFYHVHHSSHGSDKDEYEKEKDGNLWGTHP